MRHTHEEEGVKWAKKRLGEQSCGVWAQAMGGRQ
jgi:hypothetical protein